MRIARSGAIVLLFALAGLCIGSAGARAQTFTFQVCNRSGVTASVAVSAHPAVGDSRFQVEGWWVVATGTCSTLGTFPQGWFYYYAETPTGDWHGSTVNLCIQNPGPFSRIDSGGYTCASNETLVGFNGEFVNNAGTVTWTLNP